MPAQQATEPQEKHDTRMRQTVTRNHSLCPGGIGVSTVPSVNTLQVKAQTILNF